MITIVNPRISRDVGGWTCTALTRRVNPIEAQWSRNPRLVPKGFLQAPFVYKMTKNTQDQRSS
jgi:hypothetical protein